MILVSGIVAYLFESSLAARRLAGDTLWAAVYAMNVKLAAEGTDYFAAESAPSTLQHFWSLAVEEQFYLVWPPLLLLVSGVLLRRGGGKHGRGIPVSRKHAGAALALVGLTSLGLSIWQTGVAQTWAYFGLHTRAWELTAGALIAVAIPALNRLPAVLGGVLSWLGLGCVGIAVLALDENTAFPGYAAMLPVAGAVLVVLGGCAAAPWGAERVLGLPPLQAIGAVSYSWYLWHWPVLMMMPAILGWESTPLNNLFVAFIAFLISVIGYTNVEVPFRTTRWIASTGRGLLFGLAVTTALAAAAAAVFVALPQAIGSGSAITVDTGDASTVRDAVGTRAVPSNLTPTPEQAAKDAPASRADGCHQPLQEDQLKRPCDYGDRAGDKTMLLFGDSHADQWLPALDLIAAGNGYRLFSHTKAACPAAEMVVRDRKLGREYTECTSWRRQVMAEITRARPDVVLLSSSYAVGNKSPGDWSRGMTNTVSALTAQGIRVVVIGDTPRRDGETGPDCVAANLGDVSVCTTPQDQALPFGEISAAVLQSVQRSGGLTVDPTNWFCADRQCPAVIGNYLVHRDQSHVSGSYVRFLAPELERTLELA